MRRRRGSPVSSDTQLSLGTQYQSPAERSSDRGRSPVLTGTPAVTVPVTATGTKHPLKGCVPVSVVTGAGTERRRLPCEAKTICDADVLMLPAALWPTLPLPATLVCLQEYSPLPVYVSAARAVFEALRRCRRAVFGQLEWLALVSAFENGRANPYDFAGWCDAKRRMPTWKLSHREAIGPVNALPPSCTHSPWLGHVLSGYGMHLQRVAYGFEVPA